MTKMAAYENRQGKKDMPINSYFRGDYISFQVLKSALYATVGFALAVAMYILYDIEGFLTDFYKMDIPEFVKDMGVKYAIVLPPLSVGNRLQRAPAVLRPSAFTE